MGRGEDQANHSSHRRCQPCGIFFFCFIVKGYTCFIFCAPRPLGAKAAGRAIDWRERAIGNRRPRTSKASERAAFHRRNLELCSPATSRRRSNSSLSPPPSCAFCRPPSSLLSTLPTFRPDLHTIVDHHTPRRIALIAARQAARLDPARRIPPPRINTTDSLHPHHHSVRVSARANGNAHTRDTFLISASSAACLILPVCSAGGNVQGAGRRGR